MVAGSNRKKEHKDHKMLNQLIIVENIWGISKNIKNIPRENDGEENVID